MDGINQYTCQYRNKTTIKYRDSVTHSITYPMTKYRWNKTACHRLSTLALHNPTTVATNCFDFVEYTAFDRCPSLFPCRRRHSAHNSSRNQTISSLPRCSQSPIRDKYSDGSFSCRHAGIAILPSTESVHILFRFHAIGQIDLSRSAAACSCDCPTHSKDLPKSVRWRMQCCLDSLPTDAARSKCADDGFLSVALRHALASQELFHDHLLCISIEFCRTQKPIHSVWSYVLCPCKLSSTNLFNWIKNKM